METDALRVVVDPVEGGKVCSFVSRQTQRIFCQAPRENLACDFDNDGDMDIYLTNSNMRLFCAAHM